MRILGLGFCCLAAACHSAGSGRLGTAPLAFVDATVLTMDGRALPHHDVVVAGDTIASLGPTGNAPAEARRIDCVGKFVMPGLADAHAHLAPGAGTLADGA